MQPDDLFADIRAYLRQCDEQARLAAAFQRPPGLVITFYAKPTRPARVWLNLPRWLRRKQ